MLSQNFDFKLEPEYGSDPVCNSERCAEKPVPLESFFMLDHIAGSFFYSTSTPGLGGVLRQNVSDFIVREISDFKQSTPGKYIIAELTKENWDTHHFVKAFSKKLQISHKRIGFAGTKDKRAVTTQLMSIYDVSRQDVENILMKDIRIKVLGTSSKSIGLGDLIGNEFEIIVRGLDYGFEDACRIASDTTAQIRAEGGVPNFFGIQRFGSKRPITHKIGKDIIFGDMESAVFRYIAEPGPYENSETKSARDYVFKTKDIRGGLLKFPDYLGHEKALMNHLLSSPEDFKGAFECLPKNLYMMFVHAFQSRIFNRIVSERLRCGLHLNEAVAGDIVCYRSKENIPDPSRLERVCEKNVEGINNLLRRKRAFITAPLFGYDTQTAEGLPGEIESQIIESEGVTSEMFQVSHFPEVSSSGLRKEILLHVDPICSVQKTDMSGEIFCLKFRLPKGSYATTVLREYMKTDPLFM